MPTVKTFNDKEIKQLIKDCDPRLRQYIEAQARALKMGQETTALAIKKIKETAKIKKSLECCNNCILDDNRSYDAFPEQYCKEYHHCRHNTGNVKDESYWIFEGSE